MDEAVGSVDIVASAPVIAHARIANVGSAVGTFGQAVPGLPAEWAVGDEVVPGLNPNAATFYLFEARQDTGFRTNLGIASIVATPLVVEVRAMLGEQAIGTPLTLTLAPFSHTQVNRVLNEMGVTRASTACASRSRPRPAPAAASSRTSRGSTTAAATRSSCSASASPRCPERAVSGDAGPHATDRDAVDLDPVERGRLEPDQDHLDLSFPSRPPEVEAVRVIADLDRQSSCPRSGGSR